MDPTHHHPQKPIELYPSWHDRLMHWSGWERMIEFKAQIIVGLVFCIALAILIGWWISRGETSSVANTIRAEIIVQHLRNPGATPEASNETLEQDFTRLQELTLKSTSLSHRFSGIVAEEEVLQHVQPISESPFQTATNTLQKNSLPCATAISQATLLSNTGKIDDALRFLDETIDKTLDSCPTTHSYALLQKAALLKDQHKSNSVILDELLQYLSAHPEVEGAFDHLFSGKTRQVVDFLRIG